MSDLGPLFSLEIDTSRFDKDMFLSHTSFAKKIISRADMSSYNPCSTHLDTKSKLSPGGTPVSDPTLYRSLVGALQYLIFTHSDSDYDIHQICLFMRDLCKPYIVAINYILRYLHCTLSHDLSNW